MSDPTMGSLLRNGADFWASVLEFSASAFRNLGTVENIDVISLVVVQGGKVIHQWERPPDVAKQTVKLEGNLIGPDNLPLKDGVDVLLADGVGQGVHTITVTVPAERRAGSYQAHIEGGDTGRRVALLVVKVVEPEKKP